MSISPFEVMADAVSLVQDEAEDILNELPIEVQLNLAVQWNMNARINPDDSKFAKVVKFGPNEKGDYEFALIDNPWSKGKAKPEKEEKTNTESEKELTEEQKSDTKATSKKTSKKETQLAGADNAVS